jgi:thiol:disulfide interchange protein DsbD
MRQNLYYILFLLLIPFLKIQSQETEHLSVKSYTNKTIYSTSDTVFLAIKISLKGKFHINSYETDDESLIKTSIISNTDDITITNVSFPPDKLYKFSYSENQLRVYSGEFILGIKFIQKSQKDGKLNASFKFKYQACDDKTCFSPQIIDVKNEIIFDSKNPSKSTFNDDVFKQIDFSRNILLKLSSENKKTDTTKTEITNADENKVSDFIAEKGLLLGIFFIFLGGLALNLTPCIYPLIPITISYFGSQASGNKMQSIMMGVFYALGMAVTYTSLGLFASLAGGMIGAALQNPIVIVILSLIFVSLALSMFGLWEIKIPQKLAVAGNKNRSGLMGSLLMGLLVGFIAAPCIGPFVLSLVLYVSKLGSTGGTGNIILGTFLFFILSLGLGLPYIFLAAFSSSISKLPRSGEWMEGVKIIFGLILFGMAINVLEPVIPKEIFKIVFPVFIVLAGAYLILILKKGQNNKVFTYIKSIIAILAIFYGAWIMKSTSSIQNEVKWQMLGSVQEITKSIQSANKPTMIDFYADWCAQCKELDKNTYTDNEIIELSQKLNLIKIDLTKDNSEINEKYSIKGLPVVMFINSKGNELKELRVTGFLEPKEFSKKINILLENESKK